ncbi:MAG: hypothetical protein H0U63_02965 [Burkholderiales bacterium]|nr:hypothetical protein [Burkholderiales bacterium]
MKLVSSNRIIPSAGAPRLPVGPDTCVIDLIQFLEVLRREMVYGLEAIWQEAGEGALVISFPATGESPIIIEAGCWYRETSATLGARLRLVH